MICSYHDGCPPDGPACHLCRHHNDEHNKATLEAIDARRPFCWLPRESLMNFVTTMVGLLG